MVRALLIRGMLVGLVAGLLAFVFAHHFGEPQLQHAIDFQDSLARLHHESEGAEPVGRHVQRTFGLLAGTVTIGVALGGIFALTFAYAYGRLGALGPRATAALLAIGAYLTIIVVPFSKYPANPPAIGNPDTIDRRTLLYALMIAISVVSAIAAGRVRRQLVAARGAWNAAIVAGIVFVALIAVAQVVLPAAHETPAGFSADVLYRFRLASLGVNATLWAIIGLGFGAVAERLLTPEGQASRVPHAAAT
jgi:hypothetical protein